jgi:Cu(I)/Ag(I) efflux system membrane protein CusA/SilA
VPGTLSVYAERVVGGSYPDFDINRHEIARLNAWIYVDLEGVDVGSYVANAKQVLEREFTLPAGYSLIWSGQYEYMERAAERLQIVVPVVLVIIFLLLYLNFRNLSDSLIVMLSVPFSLVGGVWLLWLLDYEMSVAVGVGFIALAGLAAETGVVMLVFLEEAVARYQREGRLNTRRDLEAAVFEGAVLRVRPKMMTVTSTMVGLLPIMWGTGTGSETMRRIAAPMVDGLISATILTLVVIPVVFEWVRGWKLDKAIGRGSQASETAVASNENQH